MQMFLISIHDSLMTSALLCFRVVGLFSSRRSNFVRELTSIYGEFFCRATVHLHTLILCEQQTSDGKKDQRVVDIKHIVFSMSFIGLILVEITNFGTDKYHK